MAFGLKIWYIKAPTSLVSSLFSSKHSLTQNYRRIIDLGFAEIIHSSSQHACPTSYLTTSTQTFLPLVDSRRANGLYTVSVSPHTPKMEHRSIPNEIIAQICSFLCSHCQNPGVEYPAIPGGAPGLTVTCVPAAPLPFPWREGAIWKALEKALILTCRWGQLREYWDISTCIYNVLFNSLHWPKFPWRSGYRSNPEPRAEYKRHCSKQMPFWETRMQPFKSFWRRTDITAS